MPYRSALSRCLTVASAAEAPRSAQGLQRSTADTAAYCSILEVFTILRCERLKRSKGDNAWSVCKAESYTATVATVEDLVRINIRR